MSQNDIQAETSVNVNDKEADILADSGIDWQYWINLPYLTDLEIAALTLGVNPDLIGDINFDDITPDDSLNYKIKLRNRLVERSIKSKKLRSNPNLKSVLIWTNNFNITCSPDFILQSTHFKMPKKDYRKLYLKYKNAYKALNEETEDLPKNAGKRLKSIHQIIFAVAWGVFEFSGSNNSAAKKIHGLVTDAGFSMTEEAVRNQLNAAYNYLSEKDQLPADRHSYFYSPPIKRKDIG